MQIRLVLKYFYEGCQYISCVLSPMTSANNISNVHITWSNKIFGVASLLTCFYLYIVTIEGLTFRKNFEPMWFIFRKDNQRAYCFLHTFATKYQDVHLATVHFTF